MAKGSVLKWLVYTGIGLVFADAVFLALIAIPRMAKYPEVVRLGSVRSYSYFVIAELIIAAILLAASIRIWHDKRKIIGILFTSGIVLILLSFPSCQGANFYLDQYGFYDVANLLSICTAAKLIAGILFMVAVFKLK
jgi:hypothetical protein